MRTLALSTRLQWDSNCQQRRTLPQTASRTHRDVVQRTTDHGYHTNQPERSLPPPPSQPAPAPQLVQLGVSSLGARHEHTGHDLASRTPEALRRFRARPCSPTVSALLAIHLRNIFQEKGTGSRTSARSSSEFAIANHFGSATASVCRHWEPRQESVGEDVAPLIYSLGFRPACPGEPACTSSVKHLPTASRQARAA